MDYMTKLFKYQEAGGREYWIVDPRDETVTVYDFEHSDVGNYSFLAIGLYQRFLTNLFDESKREKKVSEARERGEKPSGPFGRNPVKSGF